MYRQLTADEVSAMQQRGCTAIAWDNICVPSEGFNPEHYRNVSFSGMIKLGVTEGKAIERQGLSYPAGIQNARLHNVEVGDGVYINGVANHIANYRIAEGVFIENVGRIATQGETTFGQGTEVSVLNETGGREVPIYDRLTAQIAFMVAMYRHNRPMVQALCHMIRDYAQSTRSTVGTIGHGTVITNTQSIINVNIGPMAVVDGAVRLNDGTLCSSANAPVAVGANVIADHFIMAGGARVDDGAVLVNCFVGQATHLTRLFSAHDSLFFANCACENGEACAVFAGPYTVTMHKSSLLIAGMFSFLNAGSGSNQSNHMYKLGPIHQGVVERGSKTTSDSYILWPAKIGPFSLVMGRHVNHPDTSRLPFSYLIEKQGEAYLVPGVNLKSVGTIRDAQKWPKRDRRVADDRLDLINFNLLSPYTVDRMMGGIGLLDNIERTAGETSEIYAYQGFKIKDTALRKGRDYYRRAIDKFMGNSVINRLRDLTHPAQLTQLLRPTSPNGAGPWVDICGMIAPKQMIESLCRDIADGKVTSLEHVDRRLRAMADNYYDLEWTWVASVLPRWCGKEWHALTPDDVCQIVERWRDSVLYLDNLLYQDAGKEYSRVAHIGFGMGGDDGQDFANVRGVFADDPFVKMVKDHMSKKSALGDDLIKRLKK